MDFFQTTPLRREMLKHTTSFVEQTTRAFFYKGSTWDERIAIVKNHIEYMENIFNDEAIAKLYVNGERIRLWEDTIENQIFSTVTKKSFGQTFYDLTAVRRSL